MKAFLESTWFELIEQRAGVRSFVTLDQTTGTPRLRTVAIDEQLIEIRGGVENALLAEEAYLKRDAGQGAL